MDGGLNKLYNGEFIGGFYNGRIYSLRLNDTKWAWVDKFLSDMSAPMTSPGAGEPGVCTRLIRDLDSVTSIESGWLKMLAQTSGSPNSNRQDVVYSTPVISRAAGIPVFNKFKVTTDSLWFMPLALLTSTTPAYNTNVSLGYHERGSLRFYVINAGNTGPNVVNFVADGTEYALCICPFPTGGGAFFIKGGAFTNWTRVWNSVYGTTENLYAGMAGSQSVLYFDYIGPGRSAFVDVVLLSDTFAGTWPTPDVVGGPWLDCSWSSAGGLAINTPAVGLELWDADAAAFTGVSTYAWAAAGTNTIANPANALVVTYVDNSSGATCTLRDSADLSSDLTVGRWYELSVDLKVNDGSNVAIQVSTPTINVTSAFFTNTDFERKTITFKADSATTAYMSFSGMGVGEIVTIKNQSLKPIPKSQLYAGMKLNTNDVLIEEIIHARTTGTQIGMMFNCDRSFAAKCAATAAAGQAVIALKEVTGVDGVGLSTVDMITVGGVQYNIASTTGGANVAYNDTTKTQTVTLAANLGAQVNADDKVGLDWAVFNTCKLYFDGTGKLRLDQVKAGVYTTIGTPPATTFVADARLVVSKIGSAYRWYYGVPGSEVLIGTTSSIDAAVMPGTYHGMFATRPEDTSKAFKVNPTGSGANEYGSQFDRYATE